MKSFIPILLLILATAFCACDTTLEEEQKVCLPVNMTATIVQGTLSTKIIADFNYIPGTKLLDHITWSNHQTHYFEYDDSDRLKVVRQMKVDVKVQEEQWFHYDGQLVDKIILVKRNLDYVYLEPVDSIYTGYISFTYEGTDIVEENHFEVAKNGKTVEEVWRVTYEYDNNGNILSSLASDPRSKSSQSVTMTYDNSRHPFSDLQYYFTGESFVNNLLSKTLNEAGFEYDYNLEVNEFGYPDIIYEKLGSTNTRIIRYTYLCS